MVGDFLSDALHELLLRFYFLVVKSVDLVVGCRSKFT